MKFKKAICYWAQILVLSICLLNFYLFADQPEGYGVDNVLVFPDTETGLVEVVFDLLGTAGTPYH